MGDAVPADDDRGNAARDHSEKKRGCDGVFHGGPRSANPTTSGATIRRAAIPWVGSMLHTAGSAAAKLIPSLLIDYFCPCGAGRLRDQIPADRLNVCEVCLDWQRHAGHGTLR